MVRNNNKGLGIAAGTVVGLGLLSAAIVSQTEACDDDVTPVVSTDTGDVGTFTPYEGSGSAVANSPEGSGDDLTPEQREAIARAERIVAEFAAETDEAMRDLAIPEGMTVDEALEVEANPDASTSGQRLAASRTIWNEVEDQERETFIALEAEVQDIIALEGEEAQAQAIMDMGVENFMQVLEETESQDILDWAVEVFLEGRDASAISESILENPALSSDFLGGFENRTFEERIAILGNTSTPPERLDVESAREAFYAIVVSYEDYRNGEIDVAELDRRVRSLTMILLTLAGNTSTPLDNLEYIAGLIIDPSMRPYLTMYEWQFPGLATLLTGNESLSAEIQMSLYQVFMSNPELDPVAEYAFSSHRGRLIRNAKDMSLLQYVVNTESHAGLVREAQRKLDEIADREENQRRANMTPEEYVQELLRDLE